MIGGESIIILVYFFLKASIRCSIFLEPRISDGLGGIGPHGIISRFAISVLTTTSFSSLDPTSTLDIPVSLPVLKSLCIRGRLMSQSIIITLEPAWAMVIARFAAQDVFPSKGPALEIRIACGALSAEEKMIPVLIPRNDSLAVDFGEWVTIRSEDAPSSWLSAEAKAGTGPRYGILRYSLISSGSLMVLSRYSKKKASPVPSARPTMMERRRLRFFFGFIGDLGVSALSTTLIFPVFISSVKEVSLNRLIKSSYMCLELSAWRWRTPYCTAFLFIERLSVFCLARAFFRDSSLATASLYSFRRELTTRPHSIAFRFFRSASSDSIATIFG